MQVILKKNTLATHAMELIPKTFQDKEIFGFKVEKTTKINEIRSVAYLLAHKRTGAQFIHLYNEDPENLISINFPTPSKNSTGVAHILEHCVLAGSKKFPVREPFFEMIKMSMATFINAMTDIDNTLYPVASNIPKDLFNLAEVYFDAVFNPLLTKETFAREGHHLRFKTNNSNVSQLSLSGIVYNEMKGVFSNPDSRLGRSISKHLLPDTIYAQESGGDPLEIPNLTYED